MKLLELEIARFGQFRDRKFVFAENGIQVIYGENEAGKSTLLDFIRQLFFGFSHRNVYANLHPEDEKPAGQALIALADGRRLQFRRQKGRKDTVRGRFEPAGEPVDEQLLAQLLGNASLDLFANVFGFSLAELTAGEKSLQDASLDEVMFGGAIGNVAAFQRLQKDLHEQHTRLLTMHSRAREFDVLLDTIARRRKELRAAQFQPHEYRHKLAEALQCEQRVEDLQQRLEQMRCQQSQTQRLMEAIPVWNQQQDIQEQLAAFTLPADVPADLGPRFQAARDAADGAALELQEISARESALRQQLEASVVDERVVAAEAEIRHVQHELGNFRRLNERLPELQKEVAAKQLAVVADLRRLDPQWDLAMLERLHLPLADRERIVELAAEYDHLQQKKTELEAQLPALRRDLETARLRLDELSGLERNPQLESLVAAKAQHDADLRAKADVERAVRRLQPEVAALRERLCSLLNVQLDNPLALTVPLESTVTDFRQKFERLEHEIQQRQSELRLVQLDQDERQRALDELDEQARVPDRQELDSRRGYRDEGWRLIRKKYIREKSVEDDIARWLKDPADSLPEAYERAVRDADLVADLRQDKAELVARHEALQRELDHLRGRSRRAEEALVESEARLETVRLEWIQRWITCRFEPLSPREMQEWLGLHAELVDKNESQQQLQLQLRDINDGLGDFHDELAAVTAAETFEERFAEVQGRVEAAREAEIERATWNQQHSEKSGELAQVEHSFAELQTALAAWDQRWRETLTQRELPTAWSPRLATRIVHALGEAHARQSEAEGLRRAAEEAQQSLQSFREHVAALSQRLAPALSQLPADDAARQLRERLDQALSARAARTSLKQQLEQLEQRAEACTHSKETAQAHRDELLRLAAAEDEAELWQIVDRVEKAHYLRDELDHLAAQLSALRGSEDPETFLKRLAVADQDALPARLETIAAEIQETDELYQAAVGERRVRRDELAKLDGNSSALALQAEVESSYGKLVSLVDCWAPLVMAEALLQQALDRFQREHQPRIMREVEQLFASLTSGRYVELRRQLDDKKSLQVRDRKQGWKNPDQLSRGTREQLYLAVRLAYVQDYCQQSEPLPLVIDDALVNFDDQRCDEALRVLRELSGTSLQTLFLTCRETMVARLQRVWPEVEVIRLGDMAATEHLGASAGPGSFQMAEG